MSENYHLRELAIALDASHSAHILPPPLPPSDRVLDIGCGAGQTLIAAYPDRISFGLDIDFDALKLGRSLAENVRFVRARAEALPWRDGEFDLVIARVSLAYTDIAASLLEVRRVLRDGGQLWMTLHPFAIPWKQAVSGNYKGWILFGYILMNSILFHFTQKQFSFRGKFESFQTDGGLTRALRRSGFEQISISRGRHYLVTARKAGFR
ncbi:MAG: class I SAM-dependent methyltransferase [Terriglobia bacterium]